MQLTEGNLKPDAILTGGANTDEPENDWEHLDPCPSCDARPHDSPMGVNVKGEPHHVFPHCWKCGYRPGVNSAISSKELRRQFDLFQQMLKDNAPTGRGIDPPAQDEVAELRRQMKEMQDQLAGRNSPNVALPDSGGFIPSTNPNVPDQPMSRPASSFGGNA